MGRDRRFESFQSSQGDWSTLTKVSLFTNDLIVTQSLGISMVNYIKNAAIQAVYNARPEYLRSIIDSGHFNMVLLDDIRVLCKPFPIWRISQCWEVISSMTGWREDILSDVEAFRMRNEEVITIFKDRLDVHFTPVDYQLYHDDFYCDSPKDTEEDQLMVDSVQELLNAGARQIDIDLYCAGAKFNYDEVLRLLNNGANPAAWLLDPIHGVQLDDRIGSECSFLDTQIASFLFSGDSRESITRRDICNLVGWAAYETMYELIETNRKYPHWISDKEDNL